MKRASITEELAYGNALDRLTGEERKPAARPRRQAIAPASAAMIKLSVFLHSEEDGYLESLSSTAKFSGGRKLSKTKLIEAMVRAFRQSQLDVRGVRNDEELYKRVIAQMRE